MAWWNTLAEGLTETALETATHIPVVGDTVAEMTGGSQMAMTTADAPPVQVEKTGIPYLMEVVGVKGAPASDKRAILFGYKEVSVAMGWAVMIALALLVGVGGYYLLKPEKKQRRTPSRRRRK